MSQPPTREPSSITSFQRSSSFKANGGDESLAFGEESIDHSTFALTSCSEIDADLTSRLVVRRQRSKNVADQTLNRLLIEEAVELNQKEIIRINEKKRLEKLRAELERSRLQKLRRYQVDIESTKARLNKLQPPHRTSLRMPCPRIVELYAVPSPQERRAVNAFFKAFS